VEKLDISGPLVPNQRTLLWNTGKLQKNNLEPKMLGNEKNWKINGDKEKSGS